jgi:hypothetical protein
MRELENLTAAWANKKSALQKMVGFDLLIMVITKFRLRRTE